MAVLSFCTSRIRPGGRWRSGLLPALLFFLLGAWGSAQAAPLRMTLIPYLSPNVLIPLFQPLARQFEKDTGRPVELYSAPNIRTHVERILRPEYDIVFTAPHMGRLSQLEAGYVPIGSFERPLIGVITVKNNGSIHRLADLRGKTVAINDRLVLNSILTLKALEENGVALSEIRIVPAASQNSALLSVAAGDVDAAITVNFALNQIGHEQQRALRVLFQTAETPQMPSTLILVHPRMPVPDRQKLAASLLRFAGTVEGQQFLRASLFMNVVEAKPAQLKNLDVYLPELRRLLRAGAGN